MRTHTVRIVHTYNVHAVRTVRALGGTSSGSGLLCGVETVRAGSSELSPAS